MSQNQDGFPELKRSHLRLSFDRIPKKVPIPAVEGEGIVSGTTAIDGFNRHLDIDLGKLKTPDDMESVVFTAEDLLDQGEIGRGAYGYVNKMVHSKSGREMAVKRIRSTVDEREQKELLMDLKVVKDTNDCPNIVQFYGATFKEGDCWICMELMDISLDKLYKYVHDYLGDCIPENILGKIALSTLWALDYLKDKMKIIHRDVKPSNILMGREGQIKLCDFGISGKLVDSIAKTRDAGCRPYMAPERIDPQMAPHGYDVRSDVWSLGISLIEVSTGKFPYPKWNSVFEQLHQVVNRDPPQLTNEGRDGFEPFSEDYLEFVNTCLIKDTKKRPKYSQLLSHRFIRKHSAFTREANQREVAEWIAPILSQYRENPPKYDFFPMDTR
ncbi:unnamed protein product [Cyprideis torosa]|uniref:mitogen-activated protein kinase kinase n=1 Tax=Cyprideis torosa TaxID=163714 RepID=A0A7R8WK28_9CRUS|nr:unnamed protein product [Cyprideis torosa]CAG0896447.1 unnamed protein product [Cyprideis torosa]